jgi:TetR/AcrR family tetracycline transcriptional repressor
MKNRSFILRWQNGVDAPMDESFEMSIDVTIRGLESLQRDLKNAGGARD